MRKILRRVLLFGSAGIILILFLAFVLISWDGFRDEDQLLIPVYPDGRKVEMFRSPVLYFDEAIEGFLGI
jgi:hypothetical protein